MSSARSAVQPVAFLGRRVTANGKLDRESVSFDPYQLVAIGYDESEIQPLVLARSENANMLETARALLTDIRGQWYRYTSYSLLKQDIDKFLDTPRDGGREEPLTLGGHVRGDKPRITNAYRYLDGSGDARIAIRYADDTKDDRPATELERMLSELSTSAPSRVTNAQSNEPLRKEPVSDFVKKLRRQADAVYLACEQDVAHDISNSLKIAADLLSLPADARSSTSSGPLEIVGWKMVPIEPTLPMLAAGKHTYAKARQMWAAMVLAAPIGPISASANIEPAPADALSEMTAKHGALLSRLNPSIEYVEETPVGYGEDEIDRLHARLSARGGEARDAVIEECAQVCDALKEQWTTPLGTTNWPQAFASAAVEIRTLKGKFK